MTVDDVPRSENGLAVGVREVGEDVCNLSHTLIRRKCVGMAQACNDSLGCGHEDVFAVEVLKTLEELHGDATRHEMAPRFGINVTQERVDGQTLDVVHRAVNHDREAGRYLAQYGYCSLAWGEACHSCSFSRLSSCRLVLLFCVFSSLDLSLLRRLLCCLNVVASLSALLEHSVSHSLCHFFEKAYVVLAEIVQVGIQTVAVEAVADEACRV